MYIFRDLKESDFLTPEYLLKGEEVHRSLYNDIQSPPLKSFFKDYSPLIAGTIPLNIHHDKSDVDLIVDVQDFQKFKDYLKAHFQIESRLGHSPTGEYLLAHFKTENFEYEFFAQKKEAFKQNAFRHMIAEHNFLSIASDETILKLKTLKKEGAKTEPAFAEVFGISGDPYVELYKLSFESSNKLRQFLDI